MVKLRGPSKPAYAPDDGDNNQLLALINNMGAGFMALDNNGQITLSNSAILGILDTNSLTGRWLSEALDVIDVNGYPIDIQKMVLLCTSTFTNSDWLLRHKDGSTINIQLNASAVRSGYGQKAHNGYVILIRDITVEKTLEQEREDFISVASHELRTPVAIAEGSLSNAKLLADRSNVPEPIKHTITAAHEQILFLGSLINDLAMLSRADRGKAAQTIETFSAVDLVNSLVSDFSPQANTKQLTINAKLQENLGLLTNSKLYVREILQNFITNSIKYTEKGGITITASAKDGGVEFMVADTGIGIDKAEQAKLFTKFYRSEDWRVRQNSGTGLGLYVTAKLAKLVGAKIDFQSELNKGSIFRIFVPSLQPAVKS